MKVLPYLLASRYCNSDLLLEMAKRSFGWMIPGYTRVKAIEQWIYNNIFYVCWLSDTVYRLQRMCWSTEPVYAVTLLIIRAMRCVVLWQEFRHAWWSADVEIEKFLPDFHAIFEAYLEGGWVDSLIRPV